MIRTLHRLALACCLLPLAQPSLAEPLRTAAPDSVQRALKANKLPNDALSLALIPLTGQGATTLVNADAPVNPASTMKLVTTYAALELLGPNYQWQTEFHGDGPLRDGTLHGNLYLKGGGDPKLNMEKLWLLLRDLRANGVHTISGDLVLDRSHFVQPDLPQFDDDGRDSNKPFLVAPDSLLINLKAVRFIARAESGRAHVAAEPPIASIRIDNRLRVLKGNGKCPGWPDVRYNPVEQYDGVTVVVSGQLVEGCSAQSYIALLDHERYAAGAVRAIWSELGGRILGQDRVDSLPANARLLARAYSPDLAEVIRDINKYSNNTMARQLFLSIGAAHRSPADVDDAAAANRVIRQWLASKRIAAPNLVMENGSGLSRIERTSARELASLLQAAWQGPYAAEFIASMPLTAMDGTMRRRLRNTELAGEAHIKTGTLNNVRAIAGYSRDRNGQTWAVVAILNHPQPWGASAVLDQVLVDLYRQPRAGDTAQR
jgi:D-alanyl-D-alanine carboxypeptidase/D-alanyl-D-alanine-endopeptidase (penicillin-binding protein 4)